jgi:hypothetical protein
MITGLASLWEDGFHLDDDPRNSGRLDYVGLGCRKHAASGSVENQGKAPCVQPCPDLPGVSGYNDFTIGG